MSIFYNEWDAKTAAWLSALVAGGELPKGQINTSSIADLKVDDLTRYHQCHFFAGIGGWPLAFRWAGIEGLTGAWSGSPPCQPFSAAGKQKGLEDDRHLSPVWLRLVRQARPSIVFGEQVEAAIRHGWLDSLFDELESQGYSCGAAILPACSLGAPHLRKRLYFGAVRLEDTQIREWSTNRRAISQHHTGQAIPDCRLAHGSRTGLEGHAGDGNNRCRGPQPSGPVAKSGRTGNRDGTGIGFWEDADWVYCKDGKVRPVEPGTFPLADGIPARVVRIRGYGNAVVPQVAAQFIRSFMDAVVDCINK